MGGVNPKLIEKIQAKLQLSRRQVYRRIASKGRQLYLPLPQAAIALSAELGIGISRLAKEEDLAAIRHAAGGRAPTSSEVRTVVIPNAAGQRRTPIRGARRAQPQPRRRGNSVFVVHGRNEKLRHSLFAFLRSIGLNPIEWRRAIALTRKPSPYVGEILDAAFREAVAIVVLFTPDDETRLRKDLIRPGDPQYEQQLTPQPRANVLFEAGMAFGHHPENTVLVQVGDIKSFSDIGGRHVVHLANSTESRQELVVKLANAGCNVDTSGTDWHSEGDFTL